MKLNCCFRKLDVTIEQKSPKMSVHIVHTRLSVREYAGVISLKRVVEDVLAETFKDSILAGERGVGRVQRFKAMVKCERLGLLAAETKKTQR